MKSNIRLLLYSITALLVAVFILIRPNSKSTTAARFSQSSAAVVSHPDIGTSGRSSGRDGKISEANMIRTLGLDADSEQAYLDYRQRKGIQSSDFFTWMDVSDISSKNIDRIVATVKAKSMADRIVRTQVASLAGPNIPPTYPLDKIAAVAHIYLNTNLIADEGPIAGVEIDGIFLLSSSRGPPDDFSSGFAVVAATGGVIIWNFSDEEAQKNAPLRPVNRGGGPTSSSAGRGGG